MKYLIPCSCGNSVSVARFQAGETVTCNCGAQVEVPALRDLGQFQVVEDSPKLARERRWSPLQGALFAVGLIALIGATIFGTLAWRDRQQLLQVQPPPVDEKLEQSLAQIDQFDYGQAYEAWRAIRENPLPARTQHVYHVAQVQARYMVRLIGISGGVAGVALLTMVGSFFLAPKPTPVPRR